MKTLLRHLPEFLSEFAASESDKYNLDKTVVSIYYYNCTVCWLIVFIYGDFPCLNIELFDKLYDFFVNLLIALFVLDNSIITNKLNPQKRFIFLNSVIFSLCRIHILFLKLHNLYFSLKQKTQLFIKYHFSIYYVTY